MRTGQLAKKHTTKEQITKEEQGTNTTCVL